MLKIFFCHTFIILFFLFSKVINDINIHIIPHTHLDPGWLKTAEEYYNYESISDIFSTITYELYGNKTCEEDEVDLDGGENNFQIKTNQTNSTKIILPQNNRTFVVSELYYFKRWYENTDPRDLPKVKRLIKQKRLEFVSGSFVSNDEANPFYNDIVDQIRIGHQFLQEEFNITPKTAWYIDSFGHSAGNAYLMGELNYENLVIGRMHENFLNFLQKTQNTEFYWQPFDDSVSNKTIFTHVLTLPYGFTNFQPKLEYDKIIFCSDVKKNLIELLKILRETYKVLRHKNIMFLFGDDFQFKNNNPFLNMDCLINAFNNAKDKLIQKKISEIFETKEKVNLFYSTPERYFSEVKKELAQNNQKLEIFKKYDFFPLKTDCFWTGYFSSRPFLKGYIRKASNAYYSISKYFSSIRLRNGTLFKVHDNLLYIEEYNNTLPNINHFREMVALTQHHDAITGTCKQYVASDYINSLRNAMRNSEINFRQNIESIFDIKIGSICYNNYIVDQKLCSTEFMISSNQNENNKIKIGLYNPLIASSSPKSNKLLINIEILISFSYYEVEGIDSDFFCLDEYNLKNEDYFKYKNKCFLNFFYEFKKGEEISYITLVKVEREKKSNRQYVLNNIKDQYQIKLIENNHKIKDMFFNPRTFEFYVEYYTENNIIKKLNFTYYDGMYYTNANNCIDGAYQFSPYNKYPEKIEIDFENSFFIIGNLGVIFVTRNIYTSFTFFIIFYNPFFIKVEHFFNCMEETYWLRRFSNGYAFIFKTNINNLKEDKKPIFYTDTNGLEMIKRKIDKFNDMEISNASIGGNFYPVTSSISIKDENNNDNNIVTIFTDKPQGGTGILPGAIILILQRMSYGTDNKGMPENLWEAESMNNTSFRTTHFILFGLNINDVNTKPSLLEQKTDLLNFIYNYFNSATLMFKIIDEGSNLEEKIFRNNELFKELFDKNLKVSPDIRAIYQIFHENLIVGEYFRYNNYFFNRNISEQINEKEKLEYGKIIFNFIDIIPNYKIFYDKRGVYYSQVKERILNEQQKKKLEIPKNQVFSLEHNEFLYIYFYIEN